ncbi:cysteine peptidase family C39 domain-containing protein [Erwinia sp. Eh17-17]|uniref:C39 family peptidase n=1 Tax=Erwinia sp. Eh17-17 TaxID=3080330 RepID=UPI00320AF629
MRMTFGFLALLLSAQVNAHNLTLKGWNSLKTEGIVRQTTDFSCGPAALSLLLKEKYGVTIGEMEILSDIIYRSARGTEGEKIKLGFSLLDLKNEAQRLGFRAKGVKFTDISDLTVNTPLLILLESESYSHFVVLTGMKEDYAEISDPERGHWHMPLYLLKSQWKGYALVTGGAYL